MNARVKTGIKRFRQRLVPNNERVRASVERVFSLPRQKRTLPEKLDRCSGGFKRIHGQYKRMVHADFSKNRLLKKEKP
ncbi:hypothetical protein, partial [Mailhella sp.]|uniref:hypothetical protein n=1 Tax=Mailhella sp. TaxID=1981029 RepID=UPI003AB5D1E0